MSEEQIKEIYIQHTRPQRDDVLSLCTTLMCHDFYSTKASKDKITHVEDYRNGNCIVTKSPMEQDYWFSDTSCNRKCNMMTMKVARSVWRLVIILHMLLTFRVLLKKEIHGRF